MPKVSCIMSVYKADKNNFKNQIKSILKQTFKDFELLVLDDGYNPFDIEEFLKSFKDSRIKYYTNNGNIGISKSYNKLLGLANGEYIALSDCDDIDNIHRFTWCVSDMDRNPELDIISGKIHIFGSVRERDDGDAMTPDRVTEELLFYDPVKNPTVMLRNSSVKKYSIRFSEDYNGAGDYEIWSRFRNLKHKIIDKILINYRKHSNNATSNKKLFRDEHAKIVQRNMKDIGLDFPIELCEMLDPYNHNIKENGKELLKMFEDSKELLLKHISLELYNRKISEMIKKCKNNF